MERKITGMWYSYYFICKRKLWYSANHIDMEQEHDNVLIGRVLDEKSYGREEKHLLIDEAINIDFIRDGEIHEIKKSNRMEEMAVAQAKYYLYYLRKLNIEVHKAVIDYPLLRQKQEVHLTEEDVSEIEENLIEIEALLQQPLPPQNYPTKKICHKCAFYDMCYI